VILAPVVLDEDERLAVTRVAALVEVHAGARAGEDLVVVRARDGLRRLLVLRGLERAGEGGRGARGLQIGGGGLRRAVGGGDPIKK
jgi:hypothetical protein